MVRQAHYSARSFAQSGKHYVGTTDDIVLRDRDTDANGAIDERIYALQDANWNVTSVATSAATIVQRFAYSPYGVECELDASFVAHNTSTTYCEFTFAGYRIDRASLLNTIRRRSYNPRVGTWISRDPLPVRSAASTYEYCLGNSVALTDPSGLGAIRPTVFSLPFGARLLIHHIVMNLSLLQGTCACELAVSGIPSILDTYLMPDTPRGVPSWPWQHCTSNCMMVAMCGSTLFSWRCAAKLSYLKEQLDALGCWLNGWAGENCNSAFQQSDFQDNFEGRVFGVTCCSQGLPTNRAACCIDMCDLTAPIGQQDGPGTIRPYGFLGDPPGPPPIFLDGPDA